MAVRPEVISLIIPPNLQRVLDAIADQQERSRSAAVRVMITRSAREMNIPVEEDANEYDEEPVLA